MLIFDIETNGLLDDVSTIHCINIYDCRSNQHNRFDRASAPIFAGLQMLREADTIVGHNIIGYDIPAIKKLQPGWEPQGEVIDTYVMSRLVFPTIRQSDFGRFQKGILPANMIGRHSLKAWGYRLGILKGAFAETTDWKEWSPEMSDYCERDVQVTFKLYDLIQTKGYSKEAARMEMQVETIIRRQESYGFLFDAKGCQELYLQLLDEREALRKEIQKEFPPFYKMKGSKVFTPKRDNAKMGYVADCPMSKIELVSFNPGSSQHVYRMLIQKYGWEPSEFTAKSYVPGWLTHLFPDHTGDINRIPEPTINEDILAALPYPESDKLSRFMLLDKRIGQMAEGKQAWIKMFKGSTRRIHGAVDILGAVTGRMTHFYPNMAQVPAARSPYGKECRSFFYAKPGYKLVGCDAEGLEARCLAHYMAKYDGGAFGKITVEGKKELKTDIHSLNAVTTGLSRDDAKTWFYAFMYGAGNRKLGSITKPTANAAAQTKEGKRLRKLFMEALPALAALTEAVQKAAKKGWILGIDGRKLYVRSEHSALNLLLQSAGALIMKKALCLCDDELQRRGHVPGVDYEFVANVHDEWQAEVREELAEEFGKVSAQAITQAGEHFGWRCPLAGDYAIGNNWYETH